MPNVIVCLIACIASFLAGKMTAEKRQDTVEGVLYNVLLNFKYFVLHHIETCKDCIGNAKDEKQKDYLNESIGKSHDIVGAVERLIKELEDDGTDDGTEPPAETEDGRWSLGL
jgi:uncharacterized protein YhaN